jgi:hypothetical protein
MQKIGLVFGFMSVFGAIAFPLLYLLGRQLKVIAAWIMRTESPKERVIPVVVIFAIIGLLAGSLAQNAWDGSSECRASGKPAVPCMFLPM